MKNSIYFILFIFSLSVNAQITNFWPVYKIQDFIFDGDVMYYVSQGDAGGSGFVAKTDFSDTTPTTEYLVNNIIYPRAITFDANFIYYNAGSKLYKIPKNIPTPTPVIVENFVQCKQLYLKNNVLYIGENNKVSKINFNETNPTKYDVVTGLSDSVLSFAEYNNELYFSYGGNISKINLATNMPTATNVISNLPNRIYGMDFFNNFLYIDQTFTNTNKFYLKYDILNLNLGYETIDVNLSYSGLGLKFKGNDVYFGRSISNMIYKYENITTLSLDEFTYNKGITVYPNPITDFFKINNLKVRNHYDIHDINGRLVGSGEVSAFDKIDVSELKSGVYLFKLDGTNAIKLIKK